MKIAIVSGASKSKDSVRGIGAHNSELFKMFRQGRNESISLPEVSPNDNLSKFDVVHFTSFRPFFRSLPLTKPKKTKFVLTIHDLIPLLYPNVYKSGIKGKLNFLLNKFLVKKYVDQIITISETSKKDIVRFLGVDPKIVNVVYLGPKSEYRPIKDDHLKKEIKNKYKLPNKFVFYFGDINYNKNIPTLVKACKKVGVSLVIGGKQALEVENMDLTHPENKHLKDINWKGVSRLGFISDEDANLVLNLARCLVQPSLYEGFGLSLVHAFAAGCPVISSKTNCLVEVGGNACLYFEPNSVDDLESKIKSLLNDKNLRKEYIKRGFERVKKFSWKKCADETLDVYEKCI